MTDDVRAALTAARRKWPTLRLKDEVAVATLEVAHKRWPQALENAADLYLACACAHGDAAALRALDTLAAQEIPAALARFREPPGFADDVRQQVMEKLLVGTARKPARIADYAGRGPLAGWLRAAAVRTALNVLEGRRSATPLDSRSPASLERNDPELAALKARFRGPFKAALQDALKGLPPEERNVLRFYFVDGLTVEQIAQMRGTHKSTVSRHITRVRGELRQAVEGALRRDSKASAGELSSILRVVRRELDLSIERVLQPSASSAAKRF